MLLVTQEKTRGKNATFWTVGADFTINIPVARLLVLLMPKTLKTIFVLKLKSRVLIILMK